MVETKLDMSSTQFIRVAETVEDDQPIEVPCEADNTILMTTLVSTFPGVCGMKYKNAKTDSMRALRLVEGRLQAPEEGWDSTAVYYCTFPKDNKRKLEDEESDLESSAKKRVDQSNNQSKSNDGDLIVLGLAWKTTEKELNEYFGQYGELALAEVKLDTRTGRSRGFGFIRFEDESKHADLIGSRHQIDGRWCDVKRSKDEDESGKPSRGRIFIGRLTKNIEVEDLREYFVKYGEITDCYIPKPHRGFGFVTFKEARHANDASAAENSIKGVALYVSTATPKTEMAAQTRGGYYDNRGRPGDRHAMPSADYGNGGGYAGGDRYGNGGGGGAGGYADHRGGAGGGAPRYNDYNVGPYNTQSYGPSHSYQASPPKYGSAPQSGGAYQDYYGRSSGAPAAGRTDTPTYHTPYASYRDYNPYYRA